MNACLYDPVLGRYLSPDPYVQAPDVPVNAFSTLAFLSGFKSLEEIVS